MPETTKVAVSNSSSVNPLDKKLATVKGQVTVTSTTGESVVVDVEELTSALSREIADLRSELSVIRNERENELKSNLLTYIQALPEKELLRLTADMSDDVLVSIQMLVDALMGRLGIDSSTEVVIQQSVGQLAQLCMWSMVVGYKLRELEALEKGGAALD